MVRWLYSWMYEYWLILCRVNIGVLTGCKKIKQRRISVVYGDGQTHICGGGATGNHVTGSDVSRATESDVSHRNRKYVLRVRNRKLRNIRFFWPEVTSVTWLEEALSWGDRVRMRNRKLRNRFPRFFSYCSTSTWIPEVTRTVCATGSWLQEVMVSRVIVQVGVLYDVRV